MKSENKKKDFYYDCDAFNILFTICGCSKDKDKDISKKQLYTFICNLNMQGVKEALKNHAEFAKETIKTSSKTKPLDLAVREIESEKVQLQICSQLIKSGADVNEKGDEITALKGTVSRIPFENYNEKMDMLNRLLESGAKPDSDIVSFLLNNDNSNWGMQYYFTLQILKKLEKYDGKPCDVWEFILAFGDKKSFKTLESLGHQPTKEEIYDTYQNYGYEQGIKVKEDELQEIIWNGESDIARKILENKMTKGKVRKEYLLQTAVDIGDYTMVRYLVEQGADINKYVKEETENYSSTALQTACASQSQEILKYLKKHGGDSKKKDSEGRSCKKIAKDNKAVWNLELIQ